MADIFSRTELLLGRSGMEKLENARVAVFGIGGVGGYAAEALARSGVGALDLIDNDRVASTNLNRQIIALRHQSRVRRPKVRAFFPTRKRGRISFRGIRLRCRRDRHRYGEDRDR